MAAQIENGSLTSCTLRKIQRIDRAGGARGDDLACREGQEDITRRGGRTGKITRTGD